MPKKVLHKTSKGVVHRSKNRTRLRVPKKFRQSQSMHAVCQKLERVPGVKSVEVNQQTGSVLIEHDERPDLLENIGAAIDESAPDLLACLLMPGGEEAELGLEMLGNVVKSLFVHKHDQAAGNGSGEPAAHPTGGPKIKRWVPIAFVAAGAWQVLQQEGLLTGIAPIALFYYGFDMYWKMRQEEMTSHIEKTTDALPTEEQLMKDIRTAAKDR